MADGQGTEVNSRIDVRATPGSFRGANSEIHPPGATPSDAQVFAFEFP
jgi:hypothetical protein